MKFMQEWNLTTFIAVKNKIPIFTMTKKEIRLKYRELRSKLTVLEISEKSLAIANRILQLPIWDKRSFHVFLPIEEKREVDTEMLLHILSGREKDIVISRSDFTTNRMSHFRLDDHTIIVRNSYGIPEPVEGDEVMTDEIDVVIVPLLAFDEYGHRIGYGKGFYDRFLSECRKDVVSVGVSFFDAEEKFSEVFDTDITLTYCVTPDKTYDFSREPA